jgi:hyperosmotically inducible periplasmic protein
MKRTSIILLVIVIIVGIVTWIVLTRTPLPQAAKGILQQASDITTTGKVKSNFSLSKRLSAYDINVDTHNGIVTLSGRVPSEIDKDLAVGVAKDTTGVIEVTNQLTVEPGIRLSEESLRESARIADLEIQADLRERLSSSPELGKENIQIAVEKRSVTLSGEVTSPKQKVGAEQVARSLSNISEVINLLSVRNPESGRNETPGVGANTSPDQTLSRQVQFALFNERENFTDINAIKSENKEAVVTLSGKVASKSERALAERIVRDLSGVKKVQNQLEVSILVQRND